MGGGAGGDDEERFEEVGKRNEKTRKIENKGAHHARGEKKELGRKK